MLTEKQQEWIDEIMDHFDFGIVHKAMTANNWKWVLDDGIHYEVPDESRLRQVARRLITHAIKDNISTSTGGFCVTIDTDCIKLEFILSGYEIWNEQQY